MTLLACTAAAWLWARGKARPAPRTARFVITLPDTADADPAISLNGLVLVHGGGNGGERALLVRRIDELEPPALEGTAGAGGPFLSPDGRWVAYFTHDKLKKVPTDGSAAPVTIGNVSPIGSGVWTTGAVLVLEQRGLGGGLFRVGADGGPLRPLAVIDSAAGETGHANPRASADGKTVEARCWPPGSTPATVAWGRRYRCCRSRTGRPQRASDQRRHSALHPGDAELRPGTG